MVAVARALDADLDLLHRWRAGDRAGGRDLFARYFDPLHRFFSNKCDDADELVQVTFVSLLKARDQFAGRSSFRTYVFTIARNELYRHLQQRRRGRQFDPLVSSIAELGTTLGSKLARNQEQRAMCAALRTLPLETQTLLELHYWDDVGITELAEIFECEPATMRMRLHRARCALREAMLVDDRALDTLARRARGGEG